jgi:hypothetical protein
MSRAFKTFLAIAIYTAFPWAVLVSIFALAGFYKDGEHHPVSNGILVLGIPITLINAFAVIFGFVWVIRHLRGNRRIGWAVAFFVGGFLTACIWWWRLVRPLPEPA